MHSDQTRTLYRENVNQAKSFHKTTLINNDGRLKKKEKIYDVKDK